MAGYLLEGVGVWGEPCTLQDYNTQNAKLKEWCPGSNECQSSKGEDGPMTGIQQVRPTLFYMSSCFFIIIFFLMQDELIVCLLLSDLRLFMMMMMMVVFPPWFLPVSGRGWLSKTKKM